MLSREYFFMRIEEGNFLLFPDSPNNSLASQFPPSKFIL